MDVFDWLVEWYKSNCDGDWEHSYGIKVDTLDNPGWIVEICLENTILENKSFQDIYIDNGDDDWIFCKIENAIFKGCCDSNKLRKVFEIFKNWAEE